MKILLLPLFTCRCGFLCTPTLKFRIQINKFQFNYRFKKKLKEKKKCAEKNELLIKHFTRQCSLVIFISFHYPQVYKSIGNIPNKKLSSDKVTRYIRGGVSKYVFLINA